MELTSNKNIERFKTLIEFTNDWIWEVNEQFQFTFTTGKIQSLLGYKPKEIIGNLLFDYFPAGESLQIQKKLEELAGQKFLDLEITFSNKNGKKVCFQTTGIPLFNSNKSFYGYRVIAKDITRQKFLENKISGLNDELEQKVKERTKILKMANEELEAFSYSVSHDLRAPLRSIDGFSQALIEDYSDSLDDTAKNYLSRVRTNAQKMSGLIDNMIKLAKVSRTSISKRKVNLSEIAESVDGLLRLENPERKVDFSIEKNMVTKADEELIKIVIQNLLENAWKFTEKNTNARISIGSAIYKNDKAYYIKDNGAGFDMNYAHKLFTPFQRLHQETDYPGTGIGLATVQRIIHRHMGEIWGEGKVGEGAVFYFTLNAG